MTELLQNAVFLSMAGGVLIVAVTVVPAYWYKARKAALETDLKREMIERGMTADDICRVIEARPGSDRS
jgi:hypothetical protein